VKLPILKYPDPKLAMKAEPVTVFDKALGDLIDNMVETMYAAKGVGLAAPQVSVLSRVIVCHIKPTDWRGLLLLVNFEITSKLPLEIQSQEGCLSFPGLEVPVIRSAHIKWKAQDSKGKFIVGESSNLEAICLQHEQDHLEGIVMMDHVSRLRRKLAIKN